MKKNWLNYTISFLVVIAIRLLPFRAPNLEPVMAFQMPLGKLHGKIQAFLFGFLSIIFYDMVTSGIGVWTIVTAIAYGFLGIWVAHFLKSRSGWKSYALCAVIGTVAYDIVTGLTVGPIFFSQPFVQAVVGQVPFTLLHLLGNVSFAIVLSPVIERWMAKETVEVSVPEFSRGLMS
jgi:uncharacterized membrane protein